MIAIVVKAGPDPDVEPCFAIGPFDTDEEAQIYWAKHVVRSAKIVGLVAP